MRMSPADSNRPSRAGDQLDAEKSANTVRPERRDASRALQGDHARHQADFERALRHAEDEDASDADADLLPLPLGDLRPLPLGEGWGEGARSAIQPARESETPTPTLPQRVTEQFRTDPETSGIDRTTPAPPSQQTTLMRQLACPLMADGTTKRLQLEFASPGSSLQRIDLERSNSGHVDLVLTAARAPANARGSLDASMDRLRARLAGRGVALGRLQLDPSDRRDEDEAL